MHHNKPFIPGGGLSNAEGTLCQREVDAFRVLDLVGCSPVPERDVDVLEEIGRTARDGFHRAANVGDHIQVEGGIELHFLVFRERSVAAGAMSAAPVVHGVPLVEEIQSSSACEVG